MSNQLNHIQQARMIPVIRANNANDAIWGAQQLISHGLTVLEITWTIPDAQKAVEVITSNNPHVSVGAGTILSWAQYEQAKAAGAHWFISPMLDEDLTKQILGDGSLYIPAIMTPTELYRACLLGAPAMKLFPAGAIGPHNGLHYLKALRGPFDPVRLIPTGGISLEAIPQWLDAGALAVGLGSSLVSPDVLAKQNATTLKERVDEALFFCRSSKPLPAQQAITTNA